MRGAIAILLASCLLTGCCPGVYPMAPGASPPFDAFQASMRLAVGMPTDVAIRAVGSTPIYSQVESCGVLAGFVWTCELLRFGWFDNNQLLVYIAPTPDGRGAVNSWTARKG